MTQNAIRLKHPLVLIHGLGAWGAYGSIDYFYGVPKLLRQLGIRFYAARLSPWMTIESRAEELKQQISAKFSDEKVNLLGHSMGGLDARYLISRLDFGEQVASLTTIGTPHRGTPLADFATGLVRGFARGLAPSGFQQLTTKYSRDVFNPAVVDDPRVAYFHAGTAISGVSFLRAYPHFWMPARFLQKREGDNDGFVSLQSASWGESLGIWKGDHYAQIGQLFGSTRGFDHLAFYKEILRRLGRAGF